MSLLLCDALSNSKGARVKLGVNGVLGGCVTRRSSDKPPVMVYKDADIIDPMLPPSFQDLAPDLRAKFMPIGETANKNCRSLALPAYELPPSNV